jgi:hypothetical protein
MNAEEVIKLLWPSEAWMSPNDDDDDTLRPGRAQADVNMVP